VVWAIPGDGKVDNGRRVDRSAADATNRIPKVIKPPLEGTLPLAQESSRTFAPLCRLSPAYPITLLSTCSAVSYKTSSPCAAPG